jgi:plastocyanin
MNSDNFVQSSVTIHKGERLSLMNDSGVPHIISNGSWENNAPKAVGEAGAPTVNDVQVASDGTQSIGLFNTAGTFHFYCTIHPGMNLTVVVQ